MIQTTENISAAIYELLAPLQMSAQVERCTDLILITPSTRKTGPLKPGQLDGMQIIYDIKENTFEVSEYQAGPLQNELYIYAVRKTIAAAVKQLLKGNNRTPLYKF